MIEFEQATGAEPAPIMGNVDAISHYWPEGPDQTGVQLADGRTVTALVPVGRLVTRSPRCAAGPCPWSRLLPRQHSSRASAGSRGAGGACGLAYAKRLFVHARMAATAAPMGIPGRCATTPYPAAGRLPSHA